MKVTTASGSSFVSDLTISSSNILAAAEKGKEALEKTQILRSRNKGSNVPLAMLFSEIPGR